MGLDTTHGAWNGSYTSFNKWRSEIAKTVGINLYEMEGFIGNKSWDNFKENDLYPLLNHSDSDGELTTDECKKIYKGLNQALKKITDPDIIYNTQLFIHACKKAIKKNEPIIFG